MPLGDSYTIGTSVRPEERWPNQLVERLAMSAATNDREAPLELVANPAVNGYTSRDVIRVELPRLDSLRPELVSLLDQAPLSVDGAAPAERARARIAQANRLRAFPAADPATELSCDGRSSAGYGHSIAIRCSAAVMPVSE